MYEVYNIQNKTSIHIPQHSPASRRSLCHQENCHGIQWRTSLARGPGWEHSPQPSNVTFQRLLSLGFLLYSHFSQVPQLTDCGGEGTWLCCKIASYLTNLPDIYFCSELPCSCTIGCENCCSISCRKIFEYAMREVLNGWNHRGCYWWARWPPQECQHLTHKALVRKSLLCKPENIALQTESRW